MEKAIARIPEDLEDESRTRNRAVDAAARKAEAMIRWEDKSRHTPRGRLADAPPARSIDQAKADRERCLNPEASAAGWIVAFCPHCQNKRADQNQSDRPKS